MSVTLHDLSFSAQVSFTAAHVEETHVDAQKPQEGQNFSPDLRHGGEKRKDQSKRFVEPPLQTSSKELDSLADSSPLFACSAHQPSLLGEQALRFGAQPNSESISHPAAAPPVDSSSSHFACEAKTPFLVPVSTSESLQSSSEECVSSFNQDEQISRSQNSGKDWREQLIQILCSLLHEQQQSLQLRQQQMQRLLEQLNYFLSSLVRWFLSERETADPAAKMPVPSSCNSSETTASPQVLEKDPVTSSCKSIRPSQLIAAHKSQYSAHPAPSDSSVSSQSPISLQPRCNVLSGTPSNGNLEEIPSVLNQFSGRAQAEIWRENLGSVSSEKLPDQTLLPPLSPAAEESFLSSGRKVIESPEVLAPLQPSLSISSEVPPSGEKAVLAPDFDQFCSRRPGEILKEIGGVSSFCTSTEKPPEKGICSRMEALGCDADFKILSEKMPSSISPAEAEILRGVCLSDVPPTERPAELPSGLQSFRGRVPEEILREISGIFASGTALEASDVPPNMISMGIPQPNQSLSPPKNGPPMVRNAEELASLSQVPPEDGSEKKSGMCLRSGSEKNDEARLFRAD